MSVLETCPAQGYSLHVIGVSDMKEPMKTKYTGNMQTPYASCYHLYTFNRGNDLLVKWMISNLHQNIYCGGRPDMREGWAFNIGSVSQIDQLRQYFEEFQGADASGVTWDEVRYVLAGAIPMMLAFLALRDERDDYTHYVQVRVFERN